MIICQNAHAGRVVQRPSAQSRISHPEQGDDPSDAARFAPRAVSHMAQDKPIPRRSSNPGSKQPHQKLTRIRTYPSWETPLSTHHSAGYKIRTLDPLITNVGIAVLHSDPIQRHSQYKARDVELNGFYLRVGKRRHAFMAQGDFAGRKRHARYVDRAAAIAGNP